MCIVCAVMYMYMYIAFMYMYKLCNFALHDFAYDVHWYSRFCTCMLVQGLSILVVSNFSSNIINSPCVESSNH